MNARITHARARTYAHTHTHTLTHTHKTLTQKYALTRCIQNLTTQFSRNEYLLSRLNRVESRLSALQVALRDLVTHIQKSTLVGSVSTQRKASSLFESDEEAEVKKLKARELGQAVCKLANECVSNISSSSATLKDIGGASDSAVEEAEALLLKNLAEWLGYIKLVG